ncbi:MAG: hypothetical protein U0270_04980 [Labilithrix sp.]
MRFRSFALATVALLIGCSASPAPAESSSEDVVGVTDLTEMESALGLKPGPRDPAKLQAGQCYQRTIGSIYGGLFEFRAYVNGAAFFPKRGTAPGTGDQRAVTCVDVDAENRPMALGGVALDVALRYRLGAPKANLFGTGHSYALFQNGMAETGYGDQFCGHGPARFGGFANAINPAFVTSDHDECLASFGRDMTEDGIDRPAFDSERYFYELELNNSRDHVSGELASLVYRYAQKSAVGVDAFTVANDPVGRLVTEDGPHLRFEHLDAHDVRAYGTQLIAITPKLSDGDIIGRAVAMCTRRVNDRGEATSDFSCRGL